MYATKDLLDHVVSIGFDRGSCVAILVGNGSLYSAGRFKLVGCISQRLVLAEFAKDFGVIPRSRQATRNPSSFESQVRSDSSRRSVHSERSP